MMNKARGIRYFYSLETFLILLLLFSCSNEKFKIEHTEDDFRTVQHYFIDPIERIDLELTNILDTDYDFQLMNTDEWGLYFDMLRIDFDEGSVEIVKQDTIHPSPRKYEYRQLKNRNEYVKKIDYLIETRGLWNIQDTLNYNRVIDGGNLSIILIGEDRVKLITWQNIERNETDDKKKVRNFYAEVWNITNQLIEEDLSSY